MAIALLAGPATPADAQIGAAQMTGKVADPAGAAVAGAGVTATTVETGAERRTEHASARQPERRGGVGRLWNDYDRRGSEGDSAGVQAVVLRSG
jgi:hypothetical protein